MSEYLVSGTCFFGIPKTRRRSSPKRRPKFTGFFKGEVKKGSLTLQTNYCSSKRATKHHHTILYPWKKSCPLQSPARTWALRAWRIKYRHFPVPPPVQIQHRPLQRHNKKRQCCRLMCHCRLTRTIPAVHITATKMNSSISQKWIKLEDSRPSSSKNPTYVRTI